MTENGYSRFLYWRITLKMNILNKLRQWFGWLAPIKLAIYFDDFSKYPKWSTHRSFFPIIHIISEIFHL